MSGSTGSVTGPPTVSSARRSSSGPTGNATAAPTSATSPSDTPRESPTLVEPAVARLPTMPARLHQPWNEASRLRPYRRWTPTPCMFMLASTAPTNSPKQATVA
jgi:hypothetical protein